MHSDVMTDSGFSTSGEQDLADGRQLIRDWRLGERQVEGPLAVWPILVDGVDHEDGGEHAAPGYVTLRESLGNGEAVITELSEGGSIPQLRIVNKGQARILVLDGEELRGAKQNRVLNTAVLINRQTSLVVPVSCTERGRWAYASREFADSEVLAERKLRHLMKMDSHASLRRGAGALADQGRVWSEVEVLFSKHHTDSRTRAMRDSYRAKKPEIDLVLAAFPCVDGQHGVLVMHGSQVMGLDFVSRAPQYAAVHDRILRSYVFEALVTGGEPGDRTVAEAFLERVAMLRGERFASPGLGDDVRFEGDGVVGSALVCRGHAVHAGFFDVGASGSPDEPGHEGRPSWRPADAREQARRRASRLRETGSSGGAGDGSVALASSTAEHVTALGGPGGRPADSRRARLLARHIASMPGLEFVTFEVYHHMGATLTDACLQRGINYGAVVIPRARRLRAEHPEVTTSAFAALLAVSDPHLVLRWKGAGAITTLLALTKLLIEEGVEREDELLAYLDRPGSKARVTAISGIKDKTFAYLRFVAGAEDAVAVDRHLRRHLADAGISAASFDDAARLYREAAAILGVSPATLEYSVFRFASSGERTRT